VLDDSGVCVGVLDIAKILNQAITRLEASVDKGTSVTEDVVKQVVQGAGGAQAQALQALLGQVMAQAFGNESSPTLGSLLAGKPPMTVVDPDTSLRDAALLMATHRKACLVVEDGQVSDVQQNSSLCDPRVLVSHLFQFSSHSLLVSVPSKIFWLEQWLRNWIWTQPVLQRS
jgi:CBS domain-containing protein